MGLGLSARDVQEVFLEWAICKDDDAGIILALDALLAFDMDQKTCSNNSRNAPVLNRYGREIQ